MPLCSVRRVDFAKLLTRELLVQVFQEVHVKVDFISCCLTASLVETISVCCRCLLNVCYQCLFLSTMFFKPQLMFWSLNFVFFSVMLLLRVKQYIIYIYMLFCYWRFHLYLCFTMLRMLEY